MIDHASAVSRRDSKSLARRRLRFSPEITRSTTHRRFRSSNPLAQAGRLTFPGSAARSGPEPSRAWDRRRRRRRMTWRDRGWASRMEASTGGAPSRSWTPAAWTRAPTSRPPVSVTTWRLRPLTFFPAWNPLGPPLSAVLTDRLSITPAVGSGARPSALRTAARRMRLMRCHNPRSRHAAQCRCTVERGGKSFGSTRRGQPLRRTRGIAFAPSRRLAALGRPRTFGGGMRGSIERHRRRSGRLRNATPRGHASLEWFQATCWASLFACNRQRGTTCRNHSVQFRASP